MVDEHGIHTMCDKIMAVKNFPQPQDVEKVRSFIGLSGYYRCFVKNFATLAFHLTQLMKKDILFHWNAAQAKSFEALKQALTNAPVLAIPGYSARFILRTDAFAPGVGAVLMQTDARGKNRVIAYASRKLNAV